MKLCLFGTQMTERINHDWKVMVYTFLFIGIVILEYQTIQNLILPKHFSIVRLKCHLFFG